MRLANLRSVDVNASGTVMLPTAPDNTIVRCGACSLSLNHISFAERILRQVSAVSTKVI